LNRAWLSAVCALGFSLGGCSLGRDCKVTDWFEVRRREPAVTAPHVVEIGEHDVTAMVKRNGSWTPLGQERWGQTVSPTALADGASVLFYSRGSWWIVRREAGEPAAVGQGWCSLRNLSASHDGKDLACASCVLSTEGDPPRCNAISVASFDTSGARRSFVSAEVPQAAQHCAWGGAQVLAFERDALVLAANCTHDSVLARVSGGTMTVLARQEHNAQGDVEKWRKVRPDLSLAKPAYPRSWDEGCQ
jgi:hypothetical protein